MGLDSELKIGVEQDGKTVIWQAPAPVAVPVAIRDAFAAPGFSDAKWDTVSVPSNWEMLGYSIPTYNSVDNTVGLYRRTIDVPQSWANRRVYWHFDGALDGAEIWVNGQKAGYHESGYTAFQVDVTDYIKAGQTNSLAVRVSKKTPSFDADTGDYQTMGGIYRDTSLMCVPQTHVSDITVTTPLSANYRDATLNAQVQIRGTAGQTVSQISGKLVGADGAATSIALNGQSTLGADGTATVALERAGERAQNVVGGKAEFILRRFAIVERRPSRRERRTAFWLSSRSKPKTTSFCGTASRSK